VKITAILAAIAAISMVTASTANAAQEKDAKKQQEVCANMNTLDAAISNLERIGPQSTVGDLKQAGDNVRKSYDTFIKSAESYAKPQADNLNNMINELRTSVKNIPESMTLSQARESVSGDVTQVRMAAAQLEHKLDCGGTAQGGTGVAPEKGNEPSGTQSPSGSGGY